VRLGRGPFLLAWLVATGAQVGAVVALSDDLGLAGLVVLVVQVLKVALAIPRLRDVGLPSEDALIGLVPLGNIGLFMQYLVLPTPSADVWEKRHQKWASRVTAFDALKAAVGPFLAIAPIAAPVVVLVALADAGMRQLFLAVPGEVAALGKEQSGQVASGLLVLAVVLGIYTLLQINKRHSASRASWLPSLLLLPVLFTWAAVAFESAGGQIVLVLITQAAALLSPALWGVHALVWVALGHRRRSGASASFGDMVAALRQSWASVVAVHGGVGQIVGLGMQVIIPGVYYLMQYVFTDMVVVIDPNKPALAQSGKLAAGLRRRIFVTLYAGLVVATVADFGVSYLIDGDGQSMMELVMTGLFDPSAGSWQADAAAGVLVLLVWGYIKLAMLEIYADRVKQLEG
jgi:hypothetical protein